MKLSDLSKNLFFLIIFISVFKTSYAEQEVDIWDNKNKKNANEEIKQIENDQNDSSIFNNNSVKPKQIIQEEAFNENDNKQFYGIWDLINIILILLCGLTQMVKMLKNS